MEYFWENTVTVSIAVSFLAYVATIYFSHGGETPVRLNHSSLKAVVVFLINYFVFVGVAVSSVFTGVIVVLFKPMIVIRALRRTYPEQCRKLGFFCKSMIIYLINGIVCAAVGVSFILACAVFAVVCPGGVLRFIKGKPIENFRRSYSS
ncbi:MAG: hypothetical protein WAV73_05685 [Candidatus Moraniibacteriota bacterium]